LGWTYRRIVEIYETNGIPCYFMMLPMLDVNEDDVNMRLAKEAGFVVLDALDAYKGHAPNPLRNGTASERRRAPIVGQESLRGHSCRRRDSEPRSHVERQRTGKREEIGAGSSGESIKGTSFNPGGLSSA
jgi:hypothetical protein